MFRLKIIREKRGLTQSDVAMLLGVSQSTYSRWENEVLQMDYETLLRAAALFEVTVDYLLGNNPKKSASYKGAVSVPVYGDVGLEKNKYILELIGYEYISKRTAGNNTYFGIKVCDNSFSPRILKNDILLVRQQSRFKSGDMVVLNFGVEWIAVKTIHKNKYDIILSDAVSDPQFFTRRNIIDNRISIIGKVIGIIGKL